MEPSAQNTIYISNNPSYKKASRAEFLSALACAEPPRSGAKPLRPDEEAPGSDRPDRFVGDVGGIYTIPLRPQWSSSSSFTQTRTEALSLSRKLGAPNSLAQIFMIP